MQQRQARFEQKHDIEANWNKAINFVPRPGEIIFYDPDENHRNTRQKVGDGKTTVINLPFMNTTYTLEQNGDKITLKGSDGNSSEVTVQTKQIQSDWSQMDDTQPDFINNRTHYDEGYTKIGIYTWSDLSYDVINDNGDYLEVIPGKKYKFIVSQEVHNNRITLCEVYDTFVNYGEEGYHRFQVDATSVEGHAFRIEHDGSDLGPERLVLHDGAEIKTPIILTVYELMPAKQLDAKFIPTDNNTILTKDGVLKVNSDLFAKPDWSQMDDTKPDFIKNRTHYMGNSLLWETTLVPGSTADAYMEYLTAPNNTYVVEISTSNGHFHREIFTVPESEHEGDYHGGWRISTTDPSDDSIITVSDGGSSGEVIVWRDIADSTVTVKLYAQSVKQLDPKFIPVDSDTIVEEDGVLKVNEDIFAKKDSVDAQKEYLTSYINNSFANALKGSVSGAAISVNDMSPITHKVTGNVNSESTITLKKQGKNLALYNSTVFDGVSIKDNQKYIYNGYLPYDCVLSWNHDFGSTGGAAFFRITTDGVKQEWSIGNPSLAISKGEKVMVQVINWGSYKGNFFNVQLERGSTPTAFEPTIAAETVEINEDGTYTTDSLYPSMSLIPSAEATVTAEYNRDINKAFAELQQAIISLGGNI